ncbi:MAG: arginine--tRNA ligase [Alphaproteobacteria bacterium]
MNFFSYLRNDVIKALEALAATGDLPAGLDTSRVAVEPPREAAHGDVATNAALVLAKEAGRKPRELAEMLAARLRECDDVVAAQVAGPGFINLRLAQPFWYERLVEILLAGPEYGASDLGHGEKVDVEYVSVNPTGPMHVGHGRGAVVGDALASLLEKVGYKVTREFYVNDAGAQVDALARSTYLRYREALGHEIGEIPEGYYPGEYLRDVAAALAARDGDKWLDKADAEWLEPVRRFAVDAIMAGIKEELAALGVAHDVFVSERALLESGGVDDVIATLEARGLIYTGVLEPPKGKVPEDWEPRPQVLFRATDFGDDVDRPLKKSDGSWTYFASDITYHLDKFHRGFHNMINVWGADHAGYVKRMQAAVTAVTDGEGVLDVKICQLVNLLDKGVPVKMSKRAGAFVTLREVVDKVGKDVVRFIMLTRKNDAPLDFDLVKVTEHSRDNPVFYVQYAHARCCSVLRHARAEFPDLDLEALALARARLDRLTGEDELGLIKLMAGWPRVVEGAAEAHEPHRLAFYLSDLAATFHALWAKGTEDASLRFLIHDDADLTVARIALVKAVAVVVASGLKVFGVEPVQELR